MIQVRRPAFVTRAVILLAILFAGTFAFFVFPPFRSFVTTIATNLRTILSGLISGFVASEFYITVIQPRIAIIAFAVGFTIAGIVALILHRGYLSFIKLGRRKSDELSGLQTRPIYNPQVIPTTVQPHAIPQPEKEESVT